MGREFMKMANGLKKKMCFFFFLALKNYVSQYFNNIVFVRVGRVHHFVYNHQLFPKMLVIEKDARG